MNLTNSVFLTVIIIGIFVFMPSNVYGINIMDVDLAAYNAALDMCSFSSTEVTSPNMPPRVEIEVNMMAEEAFIQSGFPGEWLLSYKHKFLNTCYRSYVDAYDAEEPADITLCYQRGENDALSGKARQNIIDPECKNEYNRGYDKVQPEIKQQRLTESFSEFTKEEQDIFFKNAYDAGRNNFECKEDGKKDAASDSKFRSPRNVELRASNSFANLYPEYLSVRDAGIFEGFLEGFKNGCKIAYEEGYTGKNPEEGLMDEAPDKYPDRENGYEAGYADSKCSSKGRSDYNNDEPREPPNVFEIGLRQAETNPFNLLTENSRYEKYRLGYEEGCNEAYFDAYDKARSAASSSGDGGCLIATAAYGTELSSEVQNLREIRNKMYETELGGEVMHAVNDFYYSFSPTVADWERQNLVIKETVKLLITPSMTSFTILDHNSIDSESGLIGYVVGIVSINMGMYFVAPAIVIWQIKKRI